jgi:hypothetical protein
MSKLYLPPVNKKVDVTEALRTIYRESESEFNNLCLFWDFAHWFLRGLRNFAPGTAAAGLPSTPFRDLKQRRRVRCELALVQASTEMARLMGIDLNPLVDTDIGLSLDKLRKNATAQGLLSDCAERFLTGNFASTLAYHLVTTGTVGVFVSQPTVRRDDWRPVREIVSAYQLRPMPGSIAGLDQLGGVGRVRWVPLPWLKALLPQGRLRNLDEDAARLQEVQVGSVIHDAGSPASGYVAGGVGAAPSSSPVRYGQPGHEAGKTQWGELREWWQIADNDHVTRYILQVGEAEPLIDLDYTSDEWLDRLGGVLPVPPMGLGRYREVGSFFGRGFVETIIPIYREMEFVLADWLDHARTRSRMTFTVIPTTSGINKHNFHECLRNRTIFARPDLSESRAEPKIISPGVADEALGRSVGMLAQLGQQLGAQGELLYGGAPRQLESARALAVVGQYQNVPIAGVAENINQMMSAVWRAVLGYVRHHHAILGRDIVFSLRNADETALGVIVDPKTGTVRLGERTLDDPRSVKLSIRSKDPTDKALQLAELRMLRQDGLVSLREMQINIVRFGLTKSVISRRPYLQYALAWWENLILFGDGQTPGELDANWHVDDHVIHYLVVDSLAGSMAFRVASPNVQKLILQHRDTHQKLIRRGLDEMPSLDSLSPGSQPAGVPPGLLQKLGQPVPEGMDAGMNEV